jgi:hypothetical protein
MINTPERLGQAAPRGDQRHDIFVYSYLGLRPGMLDYYVVTANGEDWQGDTLAQHMP